jgi:hypothetical protein
MELRERSRSKAASQQHEPPSAPWFLVVVVCGAANVACSARVQWSATDTVEELRRRCERATGQGRSNYLLVEQTRKPMRDHLLVQDYGLTRSQRVRLVTDDDDWFGLRGGASDIDALLALRRALTGLDKLPGWSDLDTHRDPGKCKGVVINAGGRVTKLDICKSGLSGTLQRYTVPVPRFADCTRARTRRDFAARSRAPDRADVLRRRWQ